ncbi:MAG: AmmeMemoRadiSam system radical SAM enzyme [Defluviitaleaceae bacterium]|nr:AmmeMemoRadiSam system radical SAM enzyme [Defluviitaleaceae bacterium]
MNEARAAMFWEEAESKGVLCGLCPHGCEISEYAAGFCGVRENRDGRLFALSYGQVSSVALDPIEKKPLRMFCPGTQVLSIGGYGCNLRCPFCQNSAISLEYKERRQAVTPEYIAELAVQAVPHGNIGVAYTYNEPFIGYEFLLDCARLVRGAGLKNVVVTNGFVRPEPLDRLLPFIDAMNIDLKGFTSAFYEGLCGGLEAVKETVSLSHRRCHVEISTLVIPGENAYDIENIAAWIASLSPDIPLHLSRFFPRYKYLRKAPTPREEIFRLCEIAGKHLKNVFPGNI